MTSVSPGRARRLFEGLASAILERGRPRMLHWLQERFGSGAELGAIRFEEARMHLEDALLPLTTTMRLRVAHASIAVVSIAPPKIALSTLDGVLETGFETDGGLRAEVRFEGSEDGEAWISGLFTVARVIAPEAVSTLVGSASVQVTSDRWTLTNGSFAMAGATLALSGRGDIDADGLSLIEEAKVTIEGARATPLAAALHALTGRSIALGPFADAIVAGTIAARGKRAEVDLTARAMLGTLHLTGRANEDIDLKFAGDVSIAHGLAGLGVGERHRPVGDDRASVEGTLRGPFASPRMQASATLGEIHFPRGRVAPVTLVADVTLKEKRPLGTVSIQGWSTEVRGDIGPNVELRFEDASARLIDELSIIARVERRFSWPEGTRVAGVVTFGERIGAELAIETIETAVLAKVRWSQGSFAGSTIRGRLAIADARTLGFLPAFVRGEGNAAIDGHFERALSLEIASAMVIVEPHPSIGVRLADVRASVVVGETVTIERATANALAGVLRLSGVVGRAYDLRAEAARIEELSPVIGAEIRGLLTGNAHLDVVENGLAGTAQIRIDYPVYLALQRLLPQFSKLGLAPPRREGIAPLDVTLSFEPEVVRLTSVAASVDGITLSGAGAIGPARALVGRFYATASAHWLRTSPLLALPSLFAPNVTVPISIVGTLAAPKIEADTGSLFTRTLGFDPRGAASDLASAFGSIFSPPKPPVQATVRQAGQERSELDVILDRILDHDPRSESLIADLVDRGIDPDRFDELLEARKRARRG